MITSREIVTSLFGAWRLAQFQADGLRYLDASREGARRSFWAAVIALPAAIPLTLIRHHARRFGIAYLLGQVWLDPHPKELMLRNHV